MTRKIKFRGKSLNTGMWEYGDLNTLFYDHPRIYTISRKISVDEKTVGQFTGIHDINNKEIYEGDIIKSSSGTIYYIVYNSELACFNTVVAKYNSYDEHLIFSKGSISRFSIEVIGNIHDNPELIK